MRSWPFRGGPTSSTHLDPSPLLPCLLIDIRRFNRRADEKAHGVVRRPRAVPHGKIGGTMAHATKSAAPEDNRGRDEWMTVIEMQEYMGASRSKAYDLVWSGEIVSYVVRQEAPGFEGVRGRLHRVEERQEMTAATAPGAARGRAREGASRRKELEDDRDQEH